MSIQSEGWKSLPEVHLDNSTAGSKHFSITLRELVKTIASIVKLERCYTMRLRDTAPCCRNRKDNMKNFVKISIVALVFLAGANRYAQADPPTLNGGSYHKMTPHPQTPHINDANPQGPRMRNPNVVPEIDHGLAWSGIALLAGSLAVFGSRRRKAASL